MQAVGVQYLLLVLVLTRNPPASVPSPHCSRARRREFCLDSAESVPSSKYLPVNSLRNVALQTPQSNVGLAESTTEWISRYECYSSSASLYFIQQQHTVERVRGSTHNDEVTYSTLLQILPHHTQLAKKSSDEILDLTPVGYF